MLPGIVECAGGTRVPQSNGLLVWSIELRRMGIPKPNVPWSLRDHGKLISFDNFFLGPPSMVQVELAQRDRVTCPNLILGDAIIMEPNLSWRLHEHNALPFVLRSFYEKHASMRKGDVHRTFIQTLLSAVALTHRCRDLSIP